MNNFIFSSTDLVSIWLPVVSLVSLVNSCGVCRSLVVLLLYLDGASLLILPVHSIFFNRKAGADPRVLILELGESSRDVS